jgi:RNA polymerase sigma-70 factor, ECF subfamily
MSMQHHLPDQIVRADPWKLFCPECAQKMRIRTSMPVRKGSERRTYGCACGHSETIDTALPPQRAASTTVFLRDQRPSMKMTAAPLARPEPTATLSTIPSANGRPDASLPSVRDAMLAAVPNLRAFAISLSRNADCADDLVQETLLRALRHIDSFQPGTNMSAWLFTILRNLFRSQYRYRRREVEDTDGRYVDSLRSPPEQHSRLEFEEFRVALAKLPPGQREALLLVGASGFNYAEAAAICETAVGTIKSRVNRARTRLLELLAIDGADKFGPDRTTRAIMTAGVRG